MTKDKLYKSLQLLLKDLHKVQKRSNKISKDLNIEENTDIKKAVMETEELLRIMGEKDASGSENEVGV